MNPFVHDVIGCRLLALLDTLWQCRRQSPLQLHTGPVSNARVLIGDNVHLRILAARASCMTPGEATAASVAAVRGLPACHVYRALTARGAGVKIAHAFQSLPAERDRRKSDMTECDAAQHLLQKQTPAQALVQRGKRMQDCASMHASAACQRANTSSTDERDQMQALQQPDEGEDESRTKERTGECMGFFVKLCQHHCAKTSMFAVHRGLLSI